MTQLKSRKRLVLMLCNTTDFPPHPSIQDQRLILLAIQSYYASASLSALVVSASLPFLPLNISLSSATQYGHNKCALLRCPHAEHLFSAVTSFNSFPAICLVLFFICTAFNIDSHIPSSRPGTLRCIAEGMAKASD